jgi:hypothetical protein
MKPPETGPSGHAQETPAWLAHLPGSLSLISGLRSTLELQPPAPVLPVREARLDRLSCRRKVLLTHSGFNEPPETRLSGHALRGPGNASPLLGSLSQVCVAPLALRGLQSRVSDSAMIDKPEPRRFTPPFKESTLAPR